MKYPYDYAVIGGDMRQVYLAEELSQDSNRICFYALCNTPNKQNYHETSLVSEAVSLEEACGLADCIICPIPFLRNGSFLNQSAFNENLSVSEISANLKSGQTFFAGCIPKNFKLNAAETGVQVFDLMQNTPLSFFNSFATAEGAICEAIKLSPVNLHHSSCAVLGYGKCGRTICHYLKGMFARVYAFSNEEKELAQAALIAEKTGMLKDFGTHAGEFDFIFNTIPAQVITSEILKTMKHSVTIIDIASAPGGVDFTAAAELGIRAALCPGLPGKYAPSSSAMAVKRTIKKILMEQLHQK